MEYQVVEESIDVTRVQYVYTQNLPVNVYCYLDVDGETYKVNLSFDNISANLSFKDCFTTVTFMEYYTNFGSSGLDDNGKTTKILDPAGSSENNTFIIKMKRPNMFKLHATIRHFSPKKSDTFIVIPNQLLALTGCDIRSSDTAHDSVINVGEEKFYVKKALLSFYSPHFDRMFNGNFEEADKNETALEEVVPEEFEVLLRILYPGTTTITEENVTFLWKLADRFDIQCVAKMCEEFTCSLGVDGKKTLKMSDRMDLANQYKSAKLMATLINIMKEMKM